MLFGVGERESIVRFRVKVIVIFCRFLCRCMGGKCSSMLQSAFGAQFRLEQCQSI